MSIVNRIITEATGNNYDSFGMKQPIAGKQDYIKPDFTGIIYTNEKKTIWKDLLDGQPRSRTFQTKSGQTVLCPVLQYKKRVMHDRKFRQRCSDAPTIEISNQIWCRELRRAKTNAYAGLDIRIRQEVIDRVDAYWDL